MRNDRAANRSSLCSDVADIAGHYGVLMDTANSHPYKKVERQLRHLRAMGFDTHRPLTLRLLCEAATTGSTQSTDVTLAEVFGASETDGRMEAGAGR